MKRRVCSPVTRHMKMSSLQHHKNKIHVMCSLGPILQRNSMLKSMLVDKNFPTWLLIGWQHSCQSIRNQVRKSLLACMDFIIDFFNSNNCPWPIIECLPCVLGGPQMKQHKYRCVRMMNLGYYPIIFTSFLHNAVLGHFLRFIVVRQVLVAKLTIAEEPKQGDLWK